VSVLLHFVKWRLGLTPAEAWTTAAERDCLARHAAGKRRVVEVGVWHAGTARVLRAAMSPDGTFYAVDPFEPGRLGVSLPLVIARRELDRVANGRVVWVRQAGRDAVESAIVRAGAPFDFVFLDPPQTSHVVRREWKAWSPLVAPGGLIALHDSRTSEADPAFAPDSLRFAQDVVRHDPRFDVVDEAGLTTVLRRRAD
jgi:predicted O-methyltransferase YrrM